MIVACRALGWFSAGQSGSACGIKHDLSGRAPGRCYMYTSASHRRSEGGLEQAKLEGGRVDEEQIRRSSAYKRVLD